MAKSRVRKTARWLVALPAGVGDLARRIFMGADQGTAPEYSVARGLEVRGDYEAAIAAYRGGAQTYPEEWKHLLVGARILRDHLNRLADRGGRGLERTLGEEEA